MKVLGSPTDPADIPTKSYVDGAEPFAGMCFTVDPRVGSYGLGPNSVANRAIWVRIMYCPVPIVISKIGLEIGTSSGNISVAAYQNTGSGRSAVPGTRLATSGSVACPATGYQEVSLGGTCTVQLGDWLCLTADNTTLTYARAVGSTTALAQGLLMRKDTSHPAPASNPGSLTAGSALSPYLWGIV